MQSGERWQAIEEIVNVLVEAGRGLGQGQPSVLAALKQREETMSTGIGFGIAIPHASSDCVTEVVAGFGRSKKGIEFDSLDNEPVHFIVLFHRPPRSIPDPPAHARRDREIPQTTAPCARSSPPPARRGHPQSLHQPLPRLIPLMPTVRSLLEERLRAALDALALDSSIAEVTPAADTASAITRQTPPWCSRSGSARIHANSAPPSRKNRRLRHLRPPTLAGAGFFEFPPHAHLPRTKPAPRCLPTSVCGLAPVAKPETIVIDFSSPNVAKADARRPHPLDDPWRLPRPRRAIPRPPRRHRQPHR